MIYLKHEEVAFIKTKKEFAEMYVSLLEMMHAIFLKKGETRDVGSPLHHRQSPIGCLSIAQAKCRRIESILSLDGWEADSKLLADLIEECVDTANYTLYIATLAAMLQKETVQ